MNTGVLATQHVAETRKVTYMLETLPPSLLSSFESSSVKQPLRPPCYFFLRNLKTSVTRKVVLRIKFIISVYYFVVQQARLCIPRRTSAGHSRGLQG